MARKDSSGNEPLAQERRRKILELLQEEGSARVRKLSAVFKVSEPTIRQDLERLDQEGFVTREHGGAFLRTVSQQVESQSLQHNDNIDRKMLIARRAASLVRPGDRIILDSGSTITELAKCLKDTPRPDRHNECPQHRPHNGHQPQLPPHGHRWRVQSPDPLAHRREGGPVLPQRLCRQALPRYGRHLPQPRTHPIRVSPTSSSSRR